jgi:hypothetical protein
MGFRLLSVSGLEQPILVKSKVLIMHLLIFLLSSRENLPDFAMNFMELVNKDC